MQLKLLLQLAGWMPVYEINGYEVEFPHEAYDCQVTLFSH